MNLILHLKEGLDGLNIHKDPGSLPPIDAIEPDVWMQWVGTPEVSIGLTTWIEVTYSRPYPNNLQKRGWVAKHLVQFVRDKMFVDNLTVHDRQVAYEKSVSFPKPPDIPRIDIGESMPEIEPILCWRRFVRRIRNFLRRWK